MIGLVKRMLVGGVAGPFRGLGEKALAVMLGEIGRGESGANNDGPDVARYFEAIGKKPPGNWCAAVVSYAFTKANGGLVLPFAVSAGAKRLAKNIAAAGEKVHFSEARPGDVIAWHRGKLGSWTGHVAMVEKRTKAGLLHTVEGNTGSFPAKVRRLVHDPTNERVYLVARI